MNTFIGICGWLGLFVIIGSISAHDMHSRLRFLPPRAIPGLQLPKRRWFSQKQDHFSEENKKIWHQKFYYSEEFYKLGGPVFLYIGGEFELVSSYITGGHIVEMAEQNNAFLFGLEHRYYGHSFPTHIKHIPESLELLSIEQALADLAHFITAVVKQEEFKHLAGARWVAFGCSYPGVLASWLRAKYPHVVYAAVASSAPVLAKTEFPEYEDVVARVLRDTKPGCLENIQNASQEVTVYQEAGNTTYLEELFPDVIEDVLREVNDMISSLVQINVMRTARPIELVCSVMTNEKLGSAIQRYAMLWKRFKRRIFDEAINDLFYIAWRYQTCTELGYLIVSPSVSRYPFRVQKLEKWVSDECSIFGPGYDKKRMMEGVNATNDKYGGKHPNVSRVVFTNGADDPWSPLGITSCVPEGDNYVILIPGEPHCVDFMISSGSETPAIRKAKKQIEAIVKKWLKQRNNESVSTLSSTEELAYPGITELISTTSTVQSTLKN